MKDKTIREVLDNHISNMLRSDIQGDWTDQAISQIKEIIRERIEKTRPKKGYTIDEGLAHIYCLDQIIKIVEDL